VSLERARGRRSRRSGLTLLELLLSLALTSLVLVAISMAINLNLRTLDIRRTDVEEAQLAQAILQLIARDLRNVVQPPPADEKIDLSGLAMSDALEGVEGLEGLEGLGGAEDVLGEGEGMDASANTEGIADSVVPPAAIGLYGNQYELQLDVSRLPRVEEYQQFITTEDALKLADIPSDVKTVAYYVLTPGTTSSTGASGISTFNSQLGLGEDDLLSGGLVRRELDRAVSLWAADSGNVNGLDTNAELIAPEVTALEFRFFDGIEWLSEWDSEEAGGLPLAVEIVIAVRSAMDADEQDVSRVGVADYGESYAGVLVFRLVVPLPMAKPVSQDTEDLEAVGL
jgi:hypothetical protein